MERRQPGSEGGAQLRGEGARPCTGTDIGARYRCSPETNSSMQLPAEPFRGALHLAPPLCSKVALDSAVSLPQRQRLRDPEASRPCFFAEQSMQCVGMSYPGQDVSQFFPLPGPCTPQH